MKSVELEFEKPLGDVLRELEELERKQESKPSDKRDSRIAELKGEAARLRRELREGLTAWQRVQIARHPQRPFMLDYVDLVFDDFLELHGDRHIGDDEAMPAGLATLRGRRVVLIGHQKGRDTKENLRRNFGSAHPEGYRKALRLMRLAERFKLPVVTMVDTPGAFPGIGAEQRNIAEAIAFNLREMMLLRTPIVTVILGEGGSGGALGIGVADRVLMMENAYYSVISPEGCAAILWKHRQHAPEAAEALRLTAAHLADLGIVDGVITEPEGGAHRDQAAAARILADSICQALDALQTIPMGQLLDQRYDKFRAFGAFEETGTEA